MIVITFNINIKPEYMDISMNNLILVHIKYNKNQETSYWRMCVQKMFLRMSFRNHIAAYFTFFKIPRAMNRMQIDI